MKKLWLIGLVVLLFGFQGSLVFAELNNFKPGSEPDGFRGIKWGTDISTLKDMEYLEANPAYGGVKAYTRKGDDPRLGGVNLTTIEYCFWRGKFFMVVIGTKGFVNWTGLKDAVLEKYGKGYQDNEVNNEFIEEYDWFGEIGGAGLKYNKISKKGNLFIISEEIYKEMEAYRKQEAKEGAERGF